MLDAQDNNVKLIVGGAAWQRNDARKHFVISLFWVGGW